jgi:hypothetical protein
MFGSGGTAGGGFAASSGSGGGGGAVLLNDAACAETVLEPEAVTTELTIETDVTCTSDAPSPIALYIVLDNSGSMDDNNKWVDAVDAITGFVGTDPAQGTAWTCVDQDGNSVPPPPDLPPPGTGSISVAIQYFHPENISGSPDECDGTGHSTPAVDMGPLPDNGANIISSLGQTGPGGDTPTVGALTGGTEYCADFEANNPDVECVVVLVTDGQPNGCGLTSDCPSGGNDCVDPTAAGVLTPIASSAFNDPTNSVITFTVGMEGITADGFTLLNAIAVAGGSDCTPNTPGQEACNVTATGATGLLDALNTIRESVQVSDTSTQSTTTSVTTMTTLPCEWEIPAPPPGEIFDQNLVNVQLTIGDMPQPIGNVSTEGDCAATGGGWHYDDVAAPERILACPETCTILETLTDATVQVIIGCVTEPAIPM